jgi:protein O-GlcNAc transferase
MGDLTIEQAFRLGLQHLGGGKLGEAEAIYRQIIARQPRHADAIHMLGLINRRLGNNAVAVDLIEQALAINPACTDASYNLGNALAALGKFDEAIAAYQRAILLKQNLPQCYHNLGCLLRDKGLTEEAGLAFKQEQEAIAAARNSNAKKPNPSIAYYNLGNSLSGTGRFAEAINAYRSAIAIHPDFAEAHCNLGNALVQENQLDAAITAYVQSIHLDPNLSQAHFNLGKAFYDSGQLDQAMAANRRAIALQPNYVSAQRNLASNLFEAGQLNEAIDTYRQAIANDPAEQANISSDLIYALHFHPDYNAHSLAAETKQWNDRYAKPLSRFIGPHLNDRDLNRRLRVGYVSPDFRQHVVGINLKPLFGHHDRQRFEICCYSDVTRPDSMTRWFIEHADHWHNTADLSDEELANKIREDQIDILVDLALHTQGNRLLVFARKPAPVQMTFAGYPGSTGLEAIDYRLSDPCLDPPGSDESVYSEKTIRLAHTFWCYDPGDCVDIPVSPLPAFETGHITFGCLNNFCKINSQVLDLWSEVMLQLPKSRLLLLAKHGQHRQRTIDYLHHRGVAPQQIEFISYLPRRDYLQQYHRIDIGLDTFPYNGHSTSLDSFWMGVPVVTLVGNTPVGRAGLSQLSNLGLTELSAQNPRQFVQIATDLAQDLSRLKEIRRNLRNTMERSPLMDSIAFTRSIEDAYHKSRPPLPIFTAK